MENEVKTENVGSQMSVLNAAPPEPGTAPAGDGARATADRCRVVVLLGAMPATGLARLPILVTGKWVKSGREFEITLDSFQTIIANFGKLANNDLNVDYDHACEDLERAAGNPTPSAGRILSLDPPEPFGPDPDGKQRWILYGRYEPTARARNLIRDREYRYTSAAFASHYPDRETGDDQGLTLTSVALTNQPFLDELPEVVLSIKDDAEPLFNAPSVAEVKNASRQSAEKGNTLMAKLTLKRSADGAHEAYDGDTKVGEIPHDHLCTYAKTHLADDMNLSAGTSASDTERLTRQTLDRFTKEIGAEGKSEAEIRGLVTLALNPPKAEVTLLGECITAEGRLDEIKLNALDDSGQIARSGYRRAQDAMNRVEQAYSKGQITPAMKATGAPLRLALSDGAAFRALIEDRPALVKVNTVVGVGGSGSETNESPRVLFARLVEEKKQALMLSNKSLNELEAFRQAQAQVSKESPELLKNYRSDVEKPARA